MVNIILENSDPNLGSPQNDEYGFVMRSVENALFQHHGIALGDPTTYEGRDRRQKFWYKKMYSFAAVDATKPTQESSQLRIADNSFRELQMSNTRWPQGRPAYKSLQWTLWKISTFNFCQWDSIGPYCSSLLWWIQSNPWLWVGKSITTTSSSVASSGSQFKELSSRSKMLTPGNAPKTRLISLDK